MTALNSKKIDLENIPVASISTFLERVDEGNSSETIKCGINTVNGPATAYIKLTDKPRKITAELVAAQVGRAMGLKIPRPYLVIVDTDDIPDRMKSEFKGRGLVYGYGSAEAEGMSFARLLKSDKEILKRVVGIWKDGYKDAAIFDEWIANTDRNLGNIVYSPEGDSCWLIDHDHALLGPESILWPLNPDASVNNELINALGGHFNDDEKQAIYLKANKLMTTTSLIELSQLDKDEHLAKIGEPLDSNAIAEFLEKRINNTAALICHKMGMPQLFNQ